MSDSVAEAEKTTDRSTDALRITAGNDPWVAEPHPSYVTRSSLLASRKGQPLAEREVAGGAPIPLDPANRIDKSTAIQEPLPPAQVELHSRTSLLRRRKQEAASTEQRKFDSWEGTNPIWEVAKFKLAEDWVAEPRHRTLREMRAKEMREKRAAADMLPDRHDPKFDDGCQPATTCYVSNPQPSTRTNMNQLRTAAFIDSNRNAALQMQREKKRNARQRLLDREDQFVKQQQSVARGKSRTQMKLDARQQSIEYDELRIASAQIEKLRQLRHGPHGRTRDKYFGRRVLVGILILGLAPPPSCSLRSEITSSRRGLMCTLTRSPIRSRENIIPRSPRTRMSLLF